MPQYVALSKATAQQHHQNRCHTAEERTVIETATNGLSQTIQTDNILDFPLDPVNIIGQINGCNGNHYISLRREFMFTPLQVAQMKKSEFPSGCVRHKEADRELSNVLYVAEKIEKLTVTFGNLQGAFTKKNHEPVKQKSRS